MNQELVTQKPLKSIVRFAIPVMIGSIFQQLYSMVDAVIVGRTLGLQALAAVGSTGAISFLVIGFVQGVTTGFSVLTAQHFGAQDEEQVKRSVAMSTLLCIAVTVVVTLISVLTAMPLLRLMETPEDIIAQAYDYIVVIYYGIGATVFYNMISNQVRAIGDSRTPLYFLIMASVLNIGLDFLFILAFHSGVAGAGWATVISQLVSAVACLIYAMKKYPVLRVRARHFLWSWRFAWQHLRLGLPMAFQFSITAIGVMVIQRALTRLGSDVVAAYTAASKIDMLATLAFVSVGTTMATYCAQNYGAGQYRRIRQGVKSASLMSAVLCVISLAFILIFRDLLTRLFVSEEDFGAVIDNVHLYLNINAGTYLLLAILFVLRNSIQGVGYSFLAMFAGVIELLMRIVAASVLANPLGYPGICAANPIAWLGADIFLVLAYWLVVRRMPKEDRMLPTTKAQDTQSASDAQSPAPDVQA